MHCLIRLHPGYIIHRRIDRIKVDAGMKKITFTKKKKHGIERETERQTDRERQRELTG